MASKLELVELMKDIKHFAQTHKLSSSAYENVHLSISLTRTARKTCI